MNPKPEISIILPCLDEEKSVGKCIESINKIIDKFSLNAEIIIVNNDSTDNTDNIIKSYLKDSINLKIIYEKKRGYGSACLAGLHEAGGKYLFVADADGTYNFSEIPRFIKKLREGNDLVIGNRFSGNMKKESMPWHHRYIGNPFLSFLVKWFFKVKINDIHCGARAISKETFDKVTLYTSGMEFASEMVIKYAKANLKIVEIPIEYNERVGESKLRSFVDGWRHLRFILLYSPLYLFLAPGAILLSLGTILMALFYFTHPKILGLQLYIHPMFLFSVMIITGYQLVIFSGFAKVYAITHLGDNDKIVESLFKKITIEKVGLLGSILAIIGAVIYIIILIKWVSSGFGSLNETRNSVLALTLLVVGVQTFFSAFMFSILGIKEK
jgi:glycosyltransferase involved in cell wall biosynthesis